MAVTITTASSLPTSGTIGGMPGVQCFEGWFFLGANTAYNQYAAINYSDGGQTVIFNDGSAGSTDLTFTSYDATPTFSTYTAVGAVTTGVWKHLAITYVVASSDVFAYINGVLVGSGTVTLNRTGVTVTNFEVGGFNGQVQDVVFRTTGSPTTDWLKLSMRQRNKYGATGLFKPGAWYPFFDSASALTNLASATNRFANSTLTNPGSIITAGTSAPPTSWGGGWDPARIVGGAASLAPSADSRSAASAGLALSLTFGG